MKGRYKYNELSEEYNSGWLQLHFWEVVMAFDGITAHTIHSLSHETNANFSQIIVFCILHSLSSPDQIRREGYSPMISKWEAISIYLVIAFLGVPVFNFIRVIYSGSNTGIQWLWLSSTGMFKLHLSKRDGRCRGRSIFGLNSICVVSAVRR